MKIISATSQTVTPWKNGGGSTAEVIAMPEDARLDTFDWRVSIARIDRDGPFSCFAGIDRSLALIAGRGMTLAIEGAIQELRTGAVVAFPGEARVTAILSGGPTRDLNVMTRRGRFRHGLRTVEAGSVTPSPNTAAALLIPTGGAIWLVVDGEDYELSAEDAALFDPGDGEAIRFATIDAASCWLVEVERV